jgi:hypothetical protein
MSNIDFEIGKGNEAAVAIRFHVAQHAFLTHMDFRVGSGLAALYQVGNEAEDLHFYGGRAAVLLPVNYWNNGEFKDQLDLNTYAYTTLPEMFLADVSAPKPREYLAPDGSLFLPAGRVFQQGPADEISGWRFADNLDTYGLVKAHPGQRVYVSSESESTVRTN